MVSAGDRLGGEAGKPHPKRVRGGLDPAKVHDEPEIMMPVGAPPTAEAAGAGDVVRDECALALCVLGRHRGHRARAGEVGDRGGIAAGVNLGVTGHRQVFVHREPAPLQRQPEPGHHRVGVQLSDGEFVPTRSLIWCVGVRPDPIVARLGLPMQRGRLTVDEYLTVPGHPEIHACGDAAAVPDLTRPGSVTAMTAQHAQRQGKLVADNIAASYGLGGGRIRRHPYRHHDLGFVVDLGGLKAAADPLGVRLSGLPAKAVTRGYHLLAMPANRARIATDWALDAVLSRQLVQLGLVRSGAVPLTAGTPEHPTMPTAAAPRAPNPEDWIQGGA